MTKLLSTIAVLTAFFFSGCTEAPKQESTTATETVADELVKTTATDKDGRTLELSFNNTKGTVILQFRDETIVLQQQRAASGIWYTNDHYELRGKGNDIELKKDGEIVFTHQDDIVNTSLKDENGQTLDMTFNNTANTVKIYLNGGEQIELAGQKAASGIWYKNDQYELRGKGESLELKKDGETVFQN